MTFPNNAPTLDQLKAAILEAVGLVESDITGLTIGSPSRRRRLAETISVALEAQMKGADLASAQAAMAHAILTHLPNVMTKHCQGCGRPSISGVTCGKNQPCQKGAAEGAFGLSNGAIAGIVLGTLVFAAMVVGGAVFSGSCKSQKSDVPYSEHQVQQPKSTEMDTVQPRV